VNLGEQCLNLAKINTTILRPDKKLSFLTYGLPFYVIIIQKLKTLESVY